MTTGRDIVFIQKKAEELKDEEKSVDAPAPKPDESETKADDTVEVSTEEDAKPSESDGEVVVNPDTDSNCEEKSAESAKDKAMSLAAKAGRPTSTGMLAGAGLGSILAALGAVSRSGDDNPSILSNPLLLGALGTAGGYLGGNLLHNIKTVTETPAEKSSPSIAVPGAASLAGTLGLGGFIAKDDRKATEKAIEKRFKVLHKEMLSATRAATKTNKTVPLEQVKKYIDARSEYQKVLERKGKDIKAVFGNDVKPLLSKSEKLRSSSFNPTRQLKALNPFKKIDGQRVSLPKQILKQLGMKDLKKAFTGKNIQKAITGFGTPGGRGASNAMLNALKSTKYLGPRAAALAALAGTGWLGVNTVRSLMSDNK